MKTYTDYIKGINVNKANFEHMAETGNINGTLLNDIIRLISEIKNDEHIKAKELCSKLYFSPNNEVDFTTKEEVGFWVDEQVNNKS